MILGHTDKTQYLNSCWENKNFFPVQIFSGPDGIGKKHIALEFIKTKLPNANSEKILSSQHEAVDFIEPSGNFIKVEQVKDLIAKLSLKTWHDYRFVIIDQIEKLNVQAANSLLKSLEEPPKNTYFFLITNNLDSTLPTIRSRAIVHHFSPLKEELIKQINPEAPQWAIKAAHGSPAHLFQLLNEENLEERKIAIQIYQMAKQGSKFEAFQNIKSWIKSQPKWANVLYHLMTIARDGVIFNEQPEKVINIDLISIFREQENISIEAKIKVFNLSNKLHQNFLANLDKTLCLEDFYLKTRNILQQEKP